MKYIASCFVFIAMFTVGISVAHAENRPQEPGFFQMIKEKLMGRPIPPPHGDASTTLQIHEKINVEDDTRGERPASTTIQDKRKDIQNTVMGKIEQERGEIHSLPQNRFSGMINHFDKTIAELQSILSRLQSRITKIKATGTDTTIADGFVTTATTDISQAQTSLLSLATLASSTPVLINDSANMKAGIASSTLTQMITISNETTKHIRDTQQALSKATASLFKIKIEGTATTTMQTSDSH